MNLMNMLNYEQHGVFRRRNYLLSLWGSDSWNDHLRPALFHIFKMCNYAEDRLLFWCDR